MVDIGANERIDYIYNDDIKIIQDKTAFSFSLDSLLMAYHAKELIKDRHKVAELCAGNCAATMYMAYFNKAKYDAIEIQPEIADQAKRSIALNQMENRITVHVGNVLDAFQILTKDYYDEVVVNPPYFKVPEGHKLNPDHKKAIARHELMINLEQVIEKAAGLLKMKGKLIMVHRPERLGEIMYYCLKHDLPVKQIQPYSGHSGDAANLVVVVAVKHGKSDGVVLASSKTTQDASGQYLPEIKQILFESPEAKQRRLAKEKYYFYVLLCRDGSFYGGFTNDLAKRLAAHNSGKGAKYTKTRRPVKMIYHEEFEDKRLALKREYWFKHHSRQWKEQFLREHQVDF